MTMTVGQIEQALTSVLAGQLAQSWDNVGLLLGDRSSKARRMILCIDLTAQVLREALARRVEMVLAYHPPIFKPLNRITADDQPVIWRAANAGLAVYAIHTALDALPKGTSDVLADLIDLKDRRPIEPVENPNRQSKLVVFVPADSVQRVSSAIFNLGGGTIGNYRCCSFRAAGIGTFFGSDQTSPAVGKPGRLQAVDEYRLEVLVQNDLLEELIAAIRQVHPYEQVALDVYPLRTVESDLGLGRVGRLAKPVSFQGIVSKIKRKTGLKKLWAVHAGTSKITTAAVCPGSCGSMVKKLTGRCDLFVTGEMRHHDALAAQAGGLNVICLGHGNSERLTLPRLKEILAEHLPAVSVIISTRDADPLVII